MKNGQLGALSMLVIVGAIVALVIGVVGVDIVNAVTHPACYGVGRACYANHNFTNVAYTALPHTNLQSGTARVYNASTCTGVQIGSANYTMNNSAGGILMNNNGYNASNQSIQYASYDLTTYLGGGTICTVMNNLPILFGVGLLLLAGAWFYMRG